MYIIIKTKAYATLADFGYHVYILWGFIYCSHVHNLFDFPIPWPWTYLMKVIPESRRAHWNWYLRCYCNWTYPESTDSPSRHNILLQIDHVTLRIKFVVTVSSVLALYVE